MTIFEKQYASAQIFAETSISEPAASVLRREFEIRGMKETNDFAALRIIFCARSTQSGTDSYSVDNTADTLHITAPTTQSLLLGGAHLLRNALFVKNTLQILPQALGDFSRAAQPGSSFQMDLPADLLTFLTKDSAYKGNSFVLEEAIADYCRLYFFGLSAHAIEIASNAILSMIAYRLQSTPPHEDIEDVCVLWRGLAKWGCLQENRRFLHLFFLAAQDLFTSEKNCLQHNVCQEAQKLHAAGKCAEALEVLRRVAMREPESWAVYRKKLEENDGITLPKADTPIPVYAHLWDALQAENRGV
jgi:hypothetical protein